MFRSVLYIADSLIAPYKSERLRTVFSHSGVQLLPCKYRFYFDTTSTRICKLGLQYIIFNAMQPTTS